MELVELLSAYFAFVEDDHIALPYSCYNIIITEKNYTFLSVFITQDFNKIYSKAQ